MNNNRINNKKKNDLLIFTLVISIFMLIFIGCETEKSMNQPESSDITPQLSLGFENP